MAMLDLLNEHQHWTTWGPPLQEEPRWLTDQIVKLVADRVDLEFETVAEMLLETPARHRYILLERLAATGHSVVYIGVDRVLAREVAIKIHQNEGEYASHRVMVEARALSGADHPNIVQIHDVGERDGWLFSVTELCEHDLQSWCVSAGWSEILARILEVGAGLAHLHAIGTVHGDVKPMNILIKRGTAKLADFGNAGRPGRSLLLGGTPGYVAPEVALGYRSPSSDVFALAVTAWACLFGVLPFGDLHGGARTAITLAVQRANDSQITRPLVLPRGLPRKTLALLQRALHPDPSQRPSLDKWLEDLRKVQERRQKRRQYAPLGAAGALIVTLAVLPNTAAVDRAATASAPGWVTATTTQWAIESAVAMAARGDASRAIQTLEHAAIVQGDADESRKLAVASEQVAGALENRGLAIDATLAWSLAIRFARDANDQALEVQSMTRMRESKLAIVPRYRSR